MKKFVAVAGNIGVGKSTLVAMLCQHLDWQPFYEPVAENPYLEDFYNDMRTWAFHSQIFFLTHRLRAHRLLLDHPTSAIQDRTVYEDAEVFARHLYRQGFISDRDNSAYRELYQVQSQAVQDKSVRIYNALAEGVSETLRETFRTVAEFAELHRDIVERFGRFPHRNRHLGRGNTPDEESFLAADAPRFGQ